MIVLFLFQSIYAGIHIGGWSFDFPTPVECLLWHVSSVYILGSILLYWVVDIYAWNVHPRLTELFKRRPASQVQDPEANPQNRTSFVVKGRLMEHNSGTKSAIESIDTNHGLGSYLLLSSGIHSTGRFSEPSFATTKFIRFD